MLFLSNRIMSRVSIIGEHSFSIYNSYHEPIPPSSACSLTPSMNLKCKPILNCINAEVFSYCHGHFYPCWYCASLTTCRHLSCFQHPPLPVQFFTYLSPYGPYAFWQAFINYIFWLFFSCFSSVCAAWSILIYCLLSPQLLYGTPNSSLFFASSV